LLIKLVLHIPHFACAHAAADMNTSNSCC